MNQDRYTEYEDTKRDAYDYPEELDYVSSRLYKKIRKRNVRRIISCMGAFVGVMALLTTAVNTSTVIAQTIEKIPFISELVEYVKFDKGLENAVKNDYVQVVNLEQEVNGLTLKMPYVIADSKRLVLFFELPETMSNKNNTIDYQVLLEDSINNKLDIRSSSYKFLENEFGGLNGLQAITLRTDEAAIPQDITIPVSLAKLGEHEPVVVEKFEFPLHLNYYQEPKITVLNQEVEVLGQSVVIKSIEEYPTGVEIKVSAPNNKDAIISILEIKGIDKNGAEWSIPKGTIPAITYHEEAVDIVYYLENDYFDDASLTKIEITGVGMFMKEDKMVTVDLLNQTMTPKIYDLNIKSIERKGNTANITFKSDLTSLSMHELGGVFSSRYEDSKGNAYHMTEYEKVSHVDDNLEYYLSVNWPEDNKVVLERMNTAIIKLENPVSITLEK